MRENPRVREAEKEREREREMERESESQTAHQVQDVWCHSFCLRLGQRLGKNGNIFVGGMETGAERKPGDAPPIKSLTPEEQLAANKAREKVGRQTITYQPPRRPSLCQHRKTHNPSNPPWDSHTVL